MNRPKKVLFFRLSSLGDVVIANFTAMKIKEKHPDWNLTWLTDSIYAEILTHQPWIDNIIAWNRRKDGNAGFLSILRNVRHLAFDLLIDMHDATDRSSFFSLFSGIPERYCKRVRFPLTHTTHCADEFWNTSENIAQCHKYLCAPLLTERVKSLLPETKGNLLALPIGASFAKKRWPVENWVKFCNLAMSEKYKICLLGSGSDEAETAQKIQLLTPSPQIINLVDVLSLPELVQVINMADMTISADTGSVHIARALGKPVLVMFGPTAIDDKQYVEGMRNIFYCKCDKRGCENYSCTEPCMETIDSEAVFSCVQRQFQEA